MIAPRTDATSKTNFMVCCGVAGGLLGSCLDGGTDGVWCVGASVSAVAPVVWDAIFGPDWSTRVRVALQSAPQKLIRPQNTFAPM